MTATVVSLASRRPAPPPACGCPRHRLEELSTRISDHLDATEGELLVPRDQVADLLADVLTTVGSVFNPDRLPPENERTSR